MKALKHFLKITNHRHRVIKYCFRAGIGIQGLGHDLSKYSPTEFLNSSKLYQGDRSPNEKARELYGYSVAWMHHKGRNRHHYEYWSDVNLKTRTYEPVPMPDRYIKEMVCDRIAASEVYKGKDYSDDYPLIYYQKGIDKDNMHKDTAEKLEYLLTVLKEEGKKRLFEIMRSSKEIKVI